MAEGTFATFGGKLADLADDLFHLEVNTILKDGIEARKMPSPAHAMLDLLGDYAYWLQQLEKSAAAAARNRLPAPNAGAADEPQEPDEAQCKVLASAEHTATVDDFPLVTSVHRVLAPKAFDVVRLKARQMLGDGGLLIPPPDQTVVMRIMQSCSELSAMLAALSGNQGWATVIGKTRAEMRQIYQAAVAAAGLEGGDQAVLRKMWDIGVEKVLFQTVVGLDGDIVTAIQRGCETVEYQPLRDLHLATTRQSISCWETIVTILAGFVTGGKNPKKLLTP